MEAQPVGGIEPGSAAVRGRGRGRGGQRCFWTHMIERGIIMEEFLENIMVHYRANFWKLCGAIQGHYIYCCTKMRHKLVMAVLFISI